MKTEIKVRNLRIHGFHGIRDAEKALGQIFEIDIACDMITECAPRDVLADTVCYGEICDLVARVSGGEVFNLIETLAERIAAAVFAAFPTIAAVRIEIRKPRAPIRHIVDHVAIAIERHRPG
jgi:dihydroneopterin aldolase